MGKYNPANRNTWGRIRLAIPLPPEVARLPVDPQEIQVTVQFDEQKPEKALLKTKE